MPRSITVPSGNTRYIEFTVTYSADWSVVAKRSTSVIDSEISKVTFMLKPDPFTADASATVSKTSPTADITIATGLVTVALTPANTQNLQGKYYASLRVFLTSGAVVDFEDSSYASTPYIEVEFLQGSVGAIV